MKTIRALTFIGILTYAFAENPSSNTECNYPAVANFDSTRYLQMTPLFSTHTTDEAGSIACKVIESITKSNGKVYTKTHGYYPDSEENYYYEIVCSTEEENFKTGQYWAECDVVKDAFLDDQLISSPFNTYMSIIDTDYQNYIIVYTCGKSLSGIVENYEVLQKDPKTSNGVVNDALTKIEEKNLVQFKLRNYAYCQNGNN